MISSELDLIQRYFQRDTTRRRDVLAGIGDDAALLQAPPKGHELVVTVDTLVGGVHFPMDASAQDIGYKALAVNLSDLAAMGAEPAWFTLALTLPTADEAWLTDFAQGLFDLAHSHDMQLIGGDVTRGPLSITIQAMGFVLRGQVTLRSAAKPGDAIFVTGTLGDAGAGLMIAQGKVKASKMISDRLLARLQRPNPRVTAALAIRGLPNAGIDISDGLATDLGHILSASGTGAKVHIDRLPFSEAYRSLDLEDAWQQAVTAGDDYELCFTVAPEQASEVEDWFKALDCPVTCIGEITAEPGLRWLSAKGILQVLDKRGYDHFTTRDSHV